MPDATAPRPLPGFLLLSLLIPAAAWFMLRPIIAPIPALPALNVSVGMSIIAFLLTLYLVPAVGPSMVKANLKGRDLLKTYSTPMYVCSA